MPCGDARDTITPAGGPELQVGAVVTGDALVRNGADVVGVPLGRAFKAEVWQATVAALPTNTLSSGVLTASANGALTTIDGVSVTQGRRYLVKDEATQAKNGIYVLTQLGSVSAPWILTRATDADEDDDWSQGCVVFVKQGMTNAKKLFRCTNTSAPVVDSTSIAFELYPASGGGGSGAILDDGSVPMAAALDMGGNPIENLADGSAADDAATVGQVDAVAAAFDALFPIGTSQPWFLPDSTIPAGWIKLDGSAISRTTYAALFAKMGTTWGVGDGSTTFNVPDARQLFVKGANANADLGAPAGSGATGTSPTGIGVGVANTVNRGVAGPLNTAGAQAAVVTDAGHSHTINPPHVAAWWIMRAL